MKPDNYTAANNHNNCNPYKSQQQQDGRFLWQIPVSITLLFILGNAIFSVVEVCRVWLAVPKDTEVGVMAVVATVTLFAIIGQIVATFFQWHMMREQGRTMREALTQSDKQFVLMHRPSLGFKKVGLEKHKDENGNITKMAVLKIIINNTGQALAKNVTYAQDFREMSVFEFASLSQFPEPRHQDQFRPASVIAVSASQSVEVVLGEGTAQALRNNDSTFLVWMRLNYEGLMPDPKCFLEGYWQFDNSTGRFKACPTHNDAT